MIMHRVLAAAVPMVAPVVILAAISVVIPARVVSCEAPAAPDPPESRLARRRMTNAIVHSRCSGGWSGRVRVPLTESSFGAPGGGVHAGSGRRCHRVHSWKRLGERSTNHFYRRWRRRPRCEGSVSGRGWCDRRVGQGKLMVKVGVGVVGRGNGNDVHLRLCDGNSTGADQQRQPHCHGPSQRSSAL